MTLITRDAARLEFPCANDQDVLTAAEAAGFFPPSMCREGSCGLCGAHVVAGTFEMGLYNPAVVPSGEGGVLLCRCRPRGDLELALPCTDAQIGRQAIPEREGEIVAIEPAAANMLALTVQVLPDPVLGQVADFRPGQYMELSRGTLRRAYSPSSLPNWDGRLNFLIRLVPGGAFTGWLATEARIGNRLGVRGPLGQFVLDEASPRSRVLVAGGCGLGPILSMLRHLADFQDMTPVHLIYGANHAPELLPSGVLDEIKEQLPQLDTTLCVWHPGPDWAAFRGTVAEALDGHLAQAGAEVDLYVCGPPRMLEAVERIALTHGIPPAQIFAERLPF